jgi:hypothetical protein
MIAGAPTPATNPNAARRTRGNAGPTPPWALVVVIALAAGIIGVRPARAEPPAPRRVELIGYDRLALPGEVVTVRFKVERPVLGRPDVRGAAVEMRLYRDDRRIWEPLGEARSGRDGYADLALAAPEAAGDHWVAARAIGDHASAWQSLCLAVRPRGARVIVTDIDGTICGGGAWNLARLAAGEVRSARPLPGAVEGMNALAADATIVYLTARDDALRATTLRWLDHWEMPLGPLYVSDGIELGQDPTRHKTRVMEQLAERFEVAVAFGDASTDLAAYRAASVPAVMFQGDVHRYAAAPGVAGAYTDWEALRAAVRAGRHRELFGWATQFR